MSSGMVIKYMESTRGSGYPMLETTSSWDSITMPCLAPGLRLLDGAWRAFVLTLPKNSFNFQNHKSPVAGRCGTALEGHGVTPKFQPAPPEDISESPRRFRPQREQLRHPLCSPDGEGGEASPSPRGSSAEEKGPARRMSHFHRHLLPQCSAKNRRQSFPSRLPPAGERKGKKNPGALPQPHPCRM